MSKQYFNVDGPISVSGCDFERYKQLFEREADFDQLFYTWIDENYSDGVRRLCLRDILRQNGSSHDSPATYYRTQHSNARILEIRASQEPGELAWQLQKRPKLLGEFLQEYTYMLKHDMQWSGAVVNTLETQDELLEILFRLVPEEVGRKLLPCYNVRQKSGFSSVKDMTSMFETWADERNPKWLRETVYESIEPKLWRELQDMSLDNTTKSLKYVVDHLACNSSKNALRVALSFLVNHSLEATEEDLCLVMILMDTIRECVPQNYCILPFNILIPVLYALPDQAKAFEYARMHVMSGCTEGIKFLKGCEVRNFCYWLGGMMTDCYWLGGMMKEFTPKDVKLVEGLHAFWERTIQICRG